MTITNGIQWSGMHQQRNNISRLILNFGHFKARSVADLPSGKLPNNELERSTILQLGHFQQLFVCLEGISWQLILQFCWAFLFSAATWNRKNGPNILLPTTSTAWWSSHQFSTTCSTFPKTSITSQPPLSWWVSPWQIPLNPPFLVDVPYFFQLYKPSPDH